MSATEYLFVLSKGKSFKPLKKSFDQLNGFYNGIAYIFPQESEEKLRILLKPLDIQISRRPLGEKETFDSLRQSLKAAYLQELLINKKIELDQIKIQLKTDEVTQEFIKSAIFPEDKKAEIIELIDEIEKLKEAIVWAENMEKTIKSIENRKNEDLIDPSTTCSTKFINEWLTHYNAKNLLEIPEPAHLFEAIPNVIKKGKIFFGGKGRLIQKGEAVILGGGAKTGKSLLGLNMAVSVATGATLLNVFTPTLEGIVLFLSFEDDITVILHRLGLFRLKDIEKEKLTKNIVVHNGSTPLLISSTKNKNIELTKSGNEIKSLCYSIRPILIIVDTLSKAFAYDENCNATANEMLQQSNSLFGIERGAKNNPTLLFIQHLRKSSAMQKEPLSIESIRGAGAFAAGCRTVLGFDKVDNKRILHMLGANCGEDFKTINTDNSIQMKAIFGNHSSNYDNIEENEQTQKSLISF